jgi:hypothetical protein
MLAEKKEVSSRENEPPSNMQAPSEASDERVHIDRDWLKSQTDLGSDLLINKATSKQSIDLFVSLVGGNDEPKLRGAIQAVVAQAQRELDATLKANPDRQELPYALLACREYYMQWRGRKDAYTATKRGPKGRLGLFLVRGCVRCPKADPNSVRPAVFRIHAYVFKEGKRAESRYAYHAKKKAGMNHIKCKDVDGNGDAHDPLKCTCCKHLYCTDPLHITQADGPNLKATCKMCEGLKWRRRSKSKPGEFTEGTRKEKDSYYEPIRKGMYFTSFNPPSGFTGDISVSLLKAYSDIKKDRTTSTSDAQMPRRISQRLSSRNTPNSGPRATQTPTIETIDTEPQGGGGGEEQIILSSRDEPSDGNSAFAQQFVPKIRLRALRRSPRRKVGTAGSLGRYV